MSSGVDCRCGLDLVLLLLWLWHRPAATALIRPLDWEPPCAVDVALKKTKNKQKNDNVSNALILMSSSINLGFFFLGGATLEA